jgi:predicted transposase YbfD/YdcC
MSAKKFADGIRNHWGIENRLHYVKDVVFKEDHSKIKGGRAPAIYSLIRNMVINIARLNNGNQITKFMRRYSGDIKSIMKFLE